MTRIFATQEQILQAIVERLIDQIPGFSRSTCFLSDEQIPIVCPPAQIFCTVSPSAGTFDDAMFAGGGIETLCENTSVAVSVFTQVQGDSANHSEYAMLSKERGLLTRYKTSVLRALLKDWEMQYQGNYLTRDMLSPQQSYFRAGLESLQRKGPPYYAQLVITFAISFDWDLS